MRPAVGLAPDSAYLGARMNGSNLPLGEQCHAALVKAAEMQSDAERLEKLAKRKFAQLVIAGEGSVNKREYDARANVVYIACEDAMIAAQTAANVARAEADGLRVRFSEWQTLSATARAEMGLR